MRLLLDTHIFLWAITNDHKLSSKARELMQAASAIYVSSISILEIVIKTRLKKLSIDFDIEKLIEVIARTGFLELPVTMEHVTNVYHFPHLHRDPFDHVLLAQALSEPLHLLTADAQLKRYSELVELV